MRPAFMYMPPFHPQYILIVTPPLTPPLGLWMAPQADAPMPDANSAIKHFSVRYASVIQDRRFDLPHLLAAIGPDVATFDDMKVIFHTTRSRQKAEALVCKVVYKKFRIYLGNKVSRIELPTKDAQIANKKFSIGSRKGAATRRIAAKVGASICRAVLTPAAQVKRRVFSSSGAPRPPASPPPFSLLRSTALRRRRRSREHRCRSLGCDLRPQGSGPPRDAW